MRTARTLPDPGAALLRPGALRGAAAALGSLRATLCALVLLALGVIAVAQDAADASWGVAAPLALLGLNLAAAIATHPAFRAQPALLVFHVALLALVLLVVAGRLTFLRGHVELSEGQVFDGRLSGVTRGSWHRGALERVRFANLGFRIDYAEGLRRERTRNAVLWVDAGGVERRAEIGDTDPLVLEGYRFYTSFNKGFAPSFLWQPKKGAPLRGTVHLPAYPAHEHGQAIEWVPPGSGAGLWIMLDMEDVVLDPAKRSTFRVPRAHRLIVRQGEDVRRELRPGDTLELPTGRLRYEGLKTWMGYRVFYDWTLDWLVAAAVLAVASLAWHLVAKFRRQPWDAAIDGSARARSA
jgi:cytochrome c biogenesis protein ResB